jgi:hypothetical protein
VNPKIHIPCLTHFDGSFGELGTNVGPRTGPNRRTKEQKEWWVVRSFLKRAVTQSYFSFPLAIQKGTEPYPDFMVEHRKVISWIEITEATTEEDQNEMTKVELSGKAVLLGEFGGRFKSGASEPGYAWASDIINAIKRKAGKSIFSIEGDRHLLIYPNSNASVLLFDADDESRAFGLLQAALKNDDLTDIVRGCAVHILSKKYIFFDILRTPMKSKR